MTRLTKIQPGTTPEPKGASPRDAIDAMQLHRMRNLSGCELDVIFEIGIHIKTRMTQNPAENDMVNARYSL